MNRPICILCTVVIVTILLFYHWNPWTPRGITLGQEEEENATVTVIATVTGKEKRGNEIILSIQCDNQVSLRANLGENPTIVPYIGEKIQFNGKIKEYDGATNPGQFDVQKYYAIHGVDGFVTDLAITGRNWQVDWLKEKLCQLRNALADKIEFLMPEGEAGMMKAILLGIKSDMDADRKNLYQRNGIAHILAISGLHISLIGMGIFWLLVRIRMPECPAKCRLSKCSICRKFAGCYLPRWLAMIVCILFMFLYGMMTGMSNSALRAIVMFSMKMIAMLVKRTYDMLTGIATAAILILCEQPLYVYDSGFLLSFGAVMGVAGVNPVLSRLFLFSRRNRYGEYCKIKDIMLTAWKGVLLSVSIQLATMPVILYFYYEIPVYSVLINLIVVPLMSVVMGLGIGSLFLGVIWMPLGTILTYPLVWIFNLYDTLCKLNEKLPGAVWIVGCPKAWQIILYYILLCCVILLLESRTIKRVLKNCVNRDGQKRKRWKELYAEQIDRTLQGAALIGVVSLAIILLTCNTRRFDQLCFLDVGQGDAICFITREGKCTMVDGGSTTESEIGKYVLLPFLKYQGIHEVEQWVVTHPDSDHVNGIFDVMNSTSGITVKRLMLAEAFHGMVWSENSSDRENSSSSKNLWNLMEAADESQAEIIWLQTGMYWESGETCFWVLHPGSTFSLEDVNGASVTLYMKQRGFSALLTGDIGVEEETQVIKQWKKLCESFRKQGSQWDETVTYLKVAHHGSKYSTSSEFLQAFLPRYAVISSGIRNYYGHPHQETIKRLETSGCRILRTDQCGAVMVEITGMQ